MEDIKQVITLPKPKKHKGRRSAPKAEGRKTGKPEPFEYVFSHGDVPGVLNVLATANAWWGGTTGQVKMKKLVDAYIFLATDKEACFYAGITYDQLEYFQKLHPDFYGIKEAAQQSAPLRAKKALIKDVETDKNDARWLLERVQKDTFSTRVDVTSKGKSVAPPRENRVVFVDFTGKEDEEEELLEAPEAETPPPPEAEPEATPEGHEG